jgi:hypothetical protein
MLNIPDHKGNEKQKYIEISWMAISKSQTRNAHKDAGILLMGM